jgi:DNA-binding NtrC family response regulator
MASPNIMVVSGTPEVQQIIASTLAQRGVAPIVASTLTEAKNILNRNCINIIFCSDELPQDGICALIHQTSQSPRKLPVVIVSRFDDWGALSQLSGGWRIRLRSLPAERR